MSDAIRVRFAPSPTGMFHVGGARSALFNWALARQSQGRFVLRIEDTDATRNHPEWVEGIISALAAVGISSADPAFEGPYFQSHSAEAQREAALRLFGEGRAYYCDCTREVARRTGSQQRGYDGYCRDRGLAYEPGWALRFRTPDTGVTIVEDVVRGRTEFPNNAMEDFVLARGEGTPVFVLANAVDDIREACDPWLAAPYATWAPECFNVAVFRSVAGLAQTRLTVLSEITGYVDWLFLAKPPEDEASWAKAMTRGAEAILVAVRRRWADADWTTQALRSRLEAVAAEHGLKLSKAQAPVRVAVTGRTVGLPLFESVEVLGRERTLARIDTAAAKLAAPD